MTEFPAEYDSPWKAGLEQYFPQFVEYCFPEIYADIDWSRGYESMDKEFEEVVRDAELGKRLADGWGRAGNRFPTLPFGTGLAIFTASGYWVLGPFHR